MMVFACIFMAIGLVCYPDARRTNVNSLPYLLVVSISPMHQLSGPFLIEQQTIILSLQPHASDNNQYPTINKAEFDDIADHGLRDLGLLEQDNSMRLFLWLVIQEVIFAVGWQLTPHYFFQLLHAFRIECVPGGSLPVFLSSICEYGFL